MKIDFMLDSCGGDANHDSLVRGGYIGAGKEVAILTVDRPFREYMKTGSRKARYWKRDKLSGLESGWYSCRPMAPETHIRDFHAINHSMRERSGGPMRGKYLKSVDELRVELSVKRMTESPFHYTKWFGCFTAGGRLVAYLCLERIGEIALYSRILGHGEHLKDGAVFALHCFVYNWARNDGIKHIMYGAWHSGGEGLKFWKRRCGFVPATLE